MNNKKLDYYLNLEYDLIIKKVKENNDFFYKVKTNELDDLAFYGVGDTIEDAINSFNEVKNNLFEYYYNEGLDIPEPEKTSTKDELLPSGKFIIRTSPQIHKKLIYYAKANKLSLNSYINALFNTLTTTSSILDSAEKLLTSIISKGAKDIQNKYKITDLNDIKLKLGNRKDEDEEYRKTA